MDAERTIGKVRFTVIAEELSENHHLIDWCSELICTLRSLGLEVEATYNGMPFVSFCPDEISYE